MQRKLDRLERAHAIDVERSRIARDLHDNLGADLTHLGLLCDLASSPTADPARVRAHLNELFELARQLTRRVDEMVWTVNPTQDTLKGLAAFMTHQAQSYLRAANIACRLELPDPIADISLSSTQRHHLFLTVKEALHNVVKHAQASEVRIRLRISSWRLEIEVEDNGQGIATTAEGHGSGNMRSRMESIGGHLVRMSELGRGTIVSMVIPLDSHQPE
jgi:signal transduction histidine kinase